MRKRSSDRAKIGHRPTEQHFTGKKGGKPVVRKGKGTSRKQRRQKRGTHVNRYAQV